jgi:hypothetical protein
VEQERRRTPRYPFIATAEVLAEPSGSSTAARVTELSLYGCYLEMSSPLEQGTKATIKIYAEGKFFEAHATVVYSQPNQGMGVSFQSVYPHYVNILKMWLLEAAHAKFGRRG